jgi:hypothetical protein
MSKVDLIRPARPLLRLLSPYDRTPCCVHASVHKSAVDRCPADRWLKEGACVHALAKAGDVVVFCATPQ